MSATGKVPIRESSLGARDDEIFGRSLPVEPSDTPHDILPHLRLFWANRRLILRAGTYAFLVSVLVALLIPARYQAVTRLMPPDAQSSSGLGLLAAMTSRAGAGGLGALASDMLGMKSSGALFVGILGSETVKDRLIDQFQLRKIYHDSKIEDARKDLEEHTGLSEDRKSGIISIAVTDHDPKRAAAMAQSYVIELDRLVAQVSTSSARRERIFLEERLQKVKSGLDTAAQSFSEFASKNSAIDIPAQAKAMVEAAATLQGQLIAVQAELSGLQQIYTNNNVRVRAVQARVNELQRKLNEIGSAGTQGGSPSENSLYPSIRKLPLLGVTYADLYRQTKVQETVFELLTEQYELAKVQEAKEIPAVKVLDAAVVPTKKSFPPRTAVAVLGTMVGLAMAMGWIVGKTKWEALDAGDPHKVFAGEVLTTVRARLARSSSHAAGLKMTGHQSWGFWKRPEQSIGEDREGEEK